MTSDSTVKPYELLQNGDVSKVEELIKNGTISIDYSEPNNLPLIHFCVVNDLSLPLAALLRLLPIDSEEAKKVLNKRVDGVFQSYAPIHLATAHGHYQCLRLLLGRSEIDIDLRSMEHKNALLCINEANHNRSLDTDIATFNLLVSRGINVTEKAKSNRTVSMMLASQENADLLHYIFTNANKNLSDEQVNLLLNSQDDFGDSVLHHATKCQIQRVFKYHFEEYTNATYQTIYTVCLFDIDIHLKNDEENEALDVIFYQLADLLEFVHEHRDYFRIKYPSFTDLLDADITSLSTDNHNHNDDHHHYLDADTVAKFSSLVDAWKTKLHHLETQAETRGACPVMNVTNNNPLESRRWLRLKDDEESESESESDSELDSEPDESHRKSSVKKIESTPKESAAGEAKCPFGFTEASGVPNPHKVSASSTTAPANTEAKCPFGFTADSGVPNPHTASASTIAPFASTISSSKKRESDPATKKKKSRITPVLRPAKDSQYCKDAKKRARKDTSRSGNDVEVCKSVCPKKPADVIKYLVMREVVSIRFWIYAFIWLLSIWITKEICSFTC